MNALDVENGSSCWNSDGNADGEGEEGRCCWFVLDFGTAVFPSELRLQFQAGFSAQSCVVEGRRRRQCQETSAETSSSTWTALLIDEEELEFDDVHEIQVRTLTSSSSSSSEEGVTALRLRFKEFADFYGRVTVYRLEVWGRQEEEEEEEEERQQEEEVEEER